MLFRSFSDNNKATFVVLEIPSGPEFNLSRLIERGLFSASIRKNIPPPAREEIQSRQQEIFMRIRNIAKENGARIIDPFEELCDAKECSFITTDGLYKFLNADHLNNTFVKERLHFLDKIMIDKLSSAAPNHFSR